MDNKREEYTSKPTGRILLCLLDYSYTLIYIKKKDMVESIIVKG
jgi:hypothetical protein